jgi:hypothetical protein
VTPVVHLYCLRCNHANDDDARYCSACGAGLIRAFCPHCRAINGVESHFCQACGAALPESPALKPAPQMPAAPHEAAIPSLTDVVEMPSPVAEWPPMSSALSPVAPSTFATPDPSPVLVLPRPLAEPSPRPWGRGQLMSPAQIGVLALAVGAALALAASMVLWPGDAPPELGPSAAMVAPAGVLMRPGTAPMTDPGLDRAGLRTVNIAPHATPIPAPPSARPPAGDSANGRAAAAVAAAAIGTTAPAPAAAAARPRPTRAATPQPPTTLECTPEVHAMSLCAPGATIVRRP